MKPRVRKLSNLFFRWGRDLGLEPEDCAAALVNAGLIKLLEGGFYREVPSNERVSDEDYNALILCALHDYKKQRRLV